MIVASASTGSLKPNIKNFDKAIDIGLTNGLMDAAFELMRLSQLEVPLDEGTLQNSGTVETDGEWEKGIVIGYHEPYAARLHEHPEYNFQNGRKGKYLEDPLINNADALNVRAAVKVKTEIGEKLI